MNILIVHCGKGIYGGAEVVISELAKYLVKEGHQIKLVGKDIPCGLVKETVYVNSYMELRNRTQDLIGWADVINVHNFPSTLATFPSRLRTRAVVWMCNEPAELFTNWKRKPIEAFNRWWVKSSGMGIVVADKYNADRFEKIYRVKSRIIHYGVDYDYWAKGGPSRGGDTLRLLQVGTISPYKGQINSAYTLRGLLAKNINATLTLAGIVADEQYLERLDDYHCNGQISILGQQSHNEIRELYYNHDVLLHPVEGQGGWLVPFEAMCAGLPVITIPEFPASDIIKDYNLGVVESNMLKQILDGSYKEIDTEYVRIWVRENLTWDKFGEAMLNAYKANLGK